LTKLYVNDDASSPGASCTTTERTKRNSLRLSLSKLSDLGTEPGKLKVCNGNAADSCDIVKGGNANFQVDRQTFDAYVGNSDNGCSDPTTNSVRCGGLDGSIHFDPDKDLPGYYNVHLDSANPYSNVPRGFGKHFCV